LDPFHKRVIASHQLGILLYLLLKQQLDFPQFVKVKVPFLFQSSDSLPLSGNFLI
jgi:hypothetical protein